MSYWLHLAGQLALGKHVLGRKGVNERREEKFRYPELYFSLFSYSYSRQQWSLSLPHWLCWDVRVISLVGDWFVLSPLISGSP